MTPQLEPWLKLLVAWRTPLLLLALLLTAAAWWPAGQVTFDRSLENMFPDNDPLLTPYRKVKRTFGGNEVVLAVYRDPELLNPSGEGMRRLVTVRERLLAIPGVNDVLSLDRPLGPELIVDSQSEMAERFRRLLVGYTHSADGRTAALACLLLPQDRSPAPQQETVDGIRRVIEEEPGGIITGEPVMIHDGFRFVEADGRRLGWATSLLLGLVILVSFRSLRWMLAPLVVVQMALLWTRAGFQLAGLQMSLVSSMLTAIITVIGAATVIHIIVHFREARSEGLAPEEALLRVGRRLAAPIFWACLTDAVGFAALAASRVEPVRDFGWMTAAGALAVLLAVPLAVPGLVLLGRFDRDPHTPWGEAGLNRLLAAVLGLVRRRPWPLVVLLGALALLAAWGLRWLEIETDFTRNFRASSPLVRSYDFVESELGGAGVLDVVLPAPEQLDWPYLSAVLRLEDRLRKEVRLPPADLNSTAEEANARPALSQVLSLADAVRAGSPVALDRLPDFLRRGAVAAALAKMRSQMPEFCDALHGRDPATGEYAFRIMLRAPERVEAERKQAMVAQIRAILAEFEIPNESLPEEMPSDVPEVTGTYLLLAHLIESLLRDQWVSFGLAGGGIWFMLLLAFRHPALATLAMVPNVFPILMVLGGLGWLNACGLPVRMNMGAVMIAAVSLGLSVDSSLHYIVGYQRARAAGADVAAALEQVQQRVGRAVVLATVALVIGFSVLTASDFVPTIYFGLLVSLSMLGGLVGNVLVLPLLLWVTRRESSTTNSRPERTGR